MDGGKGSRQFTKCSITRKWLGICINSQVGNSYCELRPSKRLFLYTTSKAANVEKANINLKNEDNECFKWAVTRALNAVNKNAEQITIELREQAKTLNWEGINFPTPLKDITTFEKQNRGISVNVFGYQTFEKEIKVFEGYVDPLRISEQPERTTM